MSRTKRRILWFVTVSGGALVLLACIAFTAVNRHKNTLRLVEVVKKDDKADEVEMRALLAGGADPNASLTPTPFTMMDMLRAIFHLRRQRDPGETIVMHAAVSCNDRVLGDLLGAGGDANTTDGVQTALVNAVNSGRHRNVEVLVQHGADVNLSSRIFTPLTIAALLNRLEDLSFLIAHGADPNRFDARGMSPLMYVAERYRTDVIRALLYAGAKIDLRNSDGDTALDWSAHSGNVAGLLVLLAAGADPTLRNNAGKTAEQIAIGRSGMKASRIVHNYRRNPTTR